MCLIFEFWSAHCSILSNRAQKLQVSSTRTKCFQKWKQKKKHRKSTHASDIRGLCLIHDNAGANKCKLVQEYTGNRNCGTDPQFAWFTRLEFLLTSLKSNLTRRRYEPQSLLYSVILQCMQGVPKHVYLSAFSAWILKMETEFLLRENIQPVKMN